MSKMFHKVMSLIVGDDSQSNTMRVPKNHSTPKLTERDLLRQESKIGSELFGPIPKGHRREFFCLDESTWIWHEEWKDEKGVERQSTTRYEVHPNGILKVTDGPRYQFIEGEELDNLVAATRFYYEKVAREIYSRDPQTSPAPAV
jgi:hypothetical protein